MKRYAVYMPVLVCYLAAGSGIIAQDNTGKSGWNSPEHTWSYPAASDRNKVVSEDGRPIYLNDISTKAVTDFKTRFKNVDDERWQKKSNGSFVALFKQNDVSHIVWYNSRGKWESTLKGYNEVLLPFEVRDLVKRNYYDYSIFHVDEIETITGGRKPTYLVYIRFKQLNKIIRVRDGEMDIFREFKKY